MSRVIAICLLLISSAYAQAFRASNEKPPAIPREFRGAWCAIVYNIDWPSRAGLDAATQQAELIAILDRMYSLHMNALIFQVRPECDAAYLSSNEPWSAWLSGTMGKNPGYDPLTFCIREAHRRGIEVHAWFNPFRAKANKNKPAAANHISRAAPGLTKSYADFQWCDPALPETRQRALNAMLDVTRRYDVDGIHIDDYFYPYPKNGERFADGKSNAQRRDIVDAFVADMYRSIKRVKPWVRVGISPFGIWKPGIPEGTTAQLDAYEDLACDARKWLANGWCDYMAPQLYWRIAGPQSYSLLLPWWRAQGTRPVWPGIATSRIRSTEDATRPASEIIAQLAQSRSIGKNYHGHLHWSVKAIMDDRDGITKQLRSVYTGPALVPPMPWLSRAIPQPPNVTALTKNGKVEIRWQKTDPTTAKIAIQAQINGHWRTIQVVGVENATTTLPPVSAIAITAVDRFGNASTPRVLRRP